MSKHLHADLMMQYAQDAMTTDKPWLMWEFYDGYDYDIPKREEDRWHTCHANFGFCSNGKYRRKPSTTNIEEDGRENECSVCGQPCGWGERHRKCGEAIMAAEKKHAIPEGYTLVPTEPTENQWGFLARDIILWMEMDRPTPEKLFKHLKMLGREIPNWLINEHEMKNMGTVPSKGTRAVLIYKAMIESAKELSK